MTKSQLHYFSNNFTEFEQTYEQNHCCICHVACCRSDRKIHAYCTELIRRTAHTVARLIDKQRNERVMLSHDSWFDNERTTKRLYGARERTLQISVTDHKALMWIAQRELTIIAIAASKDSKPLSCRRIFRAVCKVKTKQRSVVRSMCCVFHRKLFQSVHVLQASLSD